MMWFEDKRTTRASFNGGSAIDFEAYRTFYETKSARRRDGNLAANTSIVSRAEAGNYQMQLCGPCQLVHAGIL